MDIILSILLIVTGSVVIWKSGEGFEFAADFLGRKLSSGVKGATINAIGSSLPELLTSFFFLFILKNAEGFSGGLGTTAGSAIFNAVIIPFVVGVAVYLKFKKFDFTFSRRLIMRDGIALIIVDVLLIVLIKSGDENGYSLTWIEGAMLMVFYLIYLAFLFLTMKKSELASPDPVEIESYIVTNSSKREKIKNLSKLDFKELIIGSKKVNDTNAWGLLVVSMSVMSLACYALAEGSIILGDAIGIDLFVVSVIIAAAATSVPDTFLSYKDAQKGNYDDSVSNAFGSNVFDIGFAIGFPVMVFAFFYGSIELNGKLEESISSLLILLLIITISVFIIFISGKKLSFFKVSALFVLYIIFLAIIILKAEEVHFADVIFEKFHKWSEFFKIEFKN